MQPTISVGILKRESVRITFHNKYFCDDNVFNGVYQITLLDDQFILSGEKDVVTLSNGSLLQGEGCFTVHEVIIGIGFHWERQESQIFTGDLKLLIEERQIRIVNVLPVEEYLKSVISSEMSATSSLELLKAHAVISRSWLLAQVLKNEQIKSQNKGYSSITETKAERIKWYDREDHALFDVCADDHCQRYQGVTRVVSPLVNKAVEATSGEVLMYEETICDARFSKCCGGATELFENAWEPVHHPYLQSFVDDDGDAAMPVLKDHTIFKQWIEQPPTVFCNTDDKKVLKQVLNDYDQETNDFFRWTVSYWQAELSTLFQKRSGIDVGIIEELLPLERGSSGRIYKLRVVGSKDTYDIGKELEIRKSLSNSHLYSSAFVVEKETTANGLVFHLKGAGWGHGVGLCQIGAAVMGDRGYDYKRILMHYFRGAGLSNKY